MWSQERNSLPRIRFPVISDALRERFSIGELWLRSFGSSAEDREVDFDLPARPILEVRIVRECTSAEEGPPPGESFFWELEAGTRTQCLLMIAALGEKTGELTVDLRCPNPACRQELEIEFSLAELADLGRTVNQNGLTGVRAGNEELGFRRVTGRDQLDWLNRSFVDAKTAARVMVQTLIVSSSPQAILDARSLQDEEVQAIGAALTAADPLVNFVLRSTCPDCGWDHVHSLDLGALALKKLRHKQNDLLAMIYALALHFHWTEEQILALPPWRRSHYLALIEKERAY